MTTLNFTFSFRKEQTQTSDTESEFDRFQEWSERRKGDKAALFSNADIRPSTAQIINAPTNISPDTMLGKMPSGQKVLSSALIDRLTSNYEWKPMRAVLTAAGLYLTRTDEDGVRDLIPLFEVVSLKRLEEMSSAGLNGTEDMLSSSAAMRNVNVASLFDRSLPGYVIQLQTIAGGFNSGRTYYFAVRSVEDGQEWESRLRSAVDRAVQNRLAGPGAISRLQHQLRRCPSDNPPCSAEHRADCASRRVEARAYRA